MTGPVEVLDVAVNASLVAVLVVVARRPARRWQTGWAGKLVSLASILVITFHAGVVPVPLGAIVGLARHRHERDRCHDHGSVPLADSWPGA